MQWVRLLLSDIKSCIQNNGTASSFFQLNRGTKQGDTLSTYLFILVIILAELIRNKNYIHGVNLTDNSRKDTELVLFADDATFTLKDILSLEHCLEILKNFGKFSSPVRT